MPAALLSGSPATAAESLTHDELQLLSLLAIGFPNRTAAGLLDLPPAEADWYFQRLYRKLGVGSREDAIDRGYRCGILRVT